MQMASSEEDPNRVISICSGINQGYAFLSSIFTKDLLYENLSGDVLYTNAAENVSFYNIQVGEATQLSHMGLLAIWIGAVLVFAAILLLIYVIIIRRKK